MVEGRLAVGGDHHPAAVGKVIGFPDLAALMAGQFRDQGIGQAVIENFLYFRVGICHVKNCDRFYVNGMVSIEHAPGKISPIKRT